MDIETYNKLLDEAVVHMDVSEANRGAYITSKGTNYYLSKSGEWTIGTKGKEYFWSTKAEADRDLHMLRTGQKKPLIQSESITERVLRQSAEKREKKAIWKTFYIEDVDSGLECHVCGIDFMAGEYCFISNSNETLCLECMADRMSLIENAANKLKSDSNYE